jgi:manganese/zinc/iron transport system permease protein
MTEFWIILTGILVVASTGTLGCFLVLRKMTMVGDAISHAVLPGIVLAYLISGERNSFVMILGAAAIGLLTTFFIEFLHKKGNV